ncbi:unnamed protein product [Rotaria sp. Silwood2]|nr:unnamed protein product [Rotaria sp. Silwood2]CAF3040121.1 unnamed protein product [Rotaria sp. Silwood2]CAF3326064.1 unnamed protein product [Rotaria sp. Silwood2]CAF4137053.1 unnamed protein product [Rotaria sp. Silwood2]CAF4330722.1 unnamed protein product [Rotaria sp. Silwood2]
MYWRQVLLGYNIEKPLALPVDRKSYLDGMTTGQGLSIEIHFTSHIVEQLFQYVSRFNATLYQVCLTIYYVFLFKLTGGQRDLIVGTVTANRYRPELQRIIGMFVNTLPMRLHVDPQDTFEQLLRRVSNMMFEAEPHSNLPYQYIIQQVSMARAHKGSLIRTMFTLDEVDTTLVRLDHGLMIEPWSLSCLKSNSMQIGTPKITAAMFDMTLSLEHRADKHSIQAEMIVSRDLFDSATLVTMARQFQFIVEQLFSPMPMNMMIAEQSMSDLSLVLPEEMVDDMQCAQFPAMNGINSIGTTLINDLLLYL